MFHSSCFKRNVQFELIRNPLVVHGLGLCPSTAGGIDSIPDQGNKILHAAAKKRDVYNLNQ